MKYISLCIFSDNPLDPVAADMLLFTILFCPALLALIIVVQRPIFSRSGHTDHIRAAISAVQFSRQQIVSVFPMSPDGILFGYKLLLHSSENLFFDNGRNTILLDNAGMPIHAYIRIIRKHTVKAVLVKCVSGLGLDSAHIQVMCDICAGNAGKVLLKYLPDDGGLLRIDSISAIWPFHIAERQRPVHLACSGIIGHAAPYIFGHVLAVKLVYIHHRAQGKAASSGIAEFFFRIQGFYTQHIKASFVLECIQHISCNAVGLISNNNPELSLLCVPHHSLKFPAVVGFTCYRLICIDMNDFDVVRFCKGHALINLLLNTLFFLVVGRVSRVDNARSRASI